MLEQRMQDLPPDRAEPGPPFANVGFDVLGHGRCRPGEQEELQTQSAGVLSLHAWSVEQSTSS